MEVSKVGGQVFLKPRGHFFLRQFVGDSFAHRVVYVHLNDPRVDDEWLSNLEGLRHIEVVSIKSQNVTDEGLRRLGQLPNLISLNLVDTQVTDSGIKELRSAVPSLRRVERDRSD